MSTGGANRNPTMYVTVATAMSGYMRMPKKPVYSLELVDRMKEMMNPQEDEFAKGVILTFCPN